jgi:ferredoxin
MPNSKKIQAVVDPKKCLGCQTCLGLAPNSFQMVDNVSVFREETTDSDAVIQQAVDSCPAGAITIVNLTENRK